MREFANVVHIPQTVAMLARQVWLFRHGRLSTAEAKDGRRGYTRRMELPDPADDLQPEYDFAGAVRGKHHHAYAQGTNVVLLDSDVADAFKDSAAVNEALRLLIRLAKDQAHITQSA